MTSPEDVDVVSAPVAGDPVGPLAMYLSLQRLIMVSGANRDFAPTHIDDSAAREGGAASAYADIMFVFTMIERLLLEWAGPSAVLRRIGPVKLHDFVLSGHDLTVAGTVTEVRPGSSWDDRTGTEIDIAVRFEQGERRPVSGQGTIWLPG